MNSIFTKNHYDAVLIVGLTALASLCLNLTDATINRDGLLYLHTAQVFLRDGLSAATDIYPWPWLPVAMAILSDSFGLALHTAGLGIVLVSYCLLNYSFVKITQELGGDSKTQLLALLVILFQPMLAGYHSSIYRDPGFWGFTLLATLALIRFQKQPLFKHAMGWFIFSLTAFLFRIEGIVLLLLAPLILLLVSPAISRSTFKNCFKLTVPALCCLALGISTMWFVANIPLSDLKLFKDLSYYGNFVDNFTAIWANQTHNFVEHILPHPAKREAARAVWGMYIGIYFFKIIHVTTPLFSALLVFGLFKTWHRDFNSPSWQIIKWSIAIVAFYLFFFTISRGFLQKRYALQLFLFMAIFIPFFIQRLLALYPQKKWLKGAIYALLLAHALDSLISSSYKLNYLIDAAEWIKNNTDKNTSVVSNDGNIAYFSDRKTNWRTAIHKQGHRIYTMKWPENTIYALRVSKDQHLSATNRLFKRKAVILKTFISQDDDNLIIFKPPS